MSCSLKQMCLLKRQAEGAQAGSIWPGALQVAMHGNVEAREMIKKHELYEGGRGNRSRAELQVWPYPPPMPARSAAG